MNVSINRSIVFFFMLCVMIIPCLNTGSADEAEPERPSLLYFYENYCDACRPDVEFIDEFYALTGRHVAEYAYRAYNIRYTENRSLFDETAQTYGISPEDRFVPMVVVDGKAYVGNSKLETALPMDFIENKSTDSLIYYLYSPACESCAAAEKVIDGLDGRVTVKRGQVEFDSDLIIEKINIYDNPSKAQALFTRYHVPEFQQTTPVVFLRDDYVNGAEQIEKRLPYMLNKGLAVGTPLLSDKQTDINRELSLTGTALAGFVAGFNPCALSMLLLFLSILLANGERIIRYAFVYLSAKFATYLAIGTVFLSILSTWNPAWLPRVAKLILTGVGGILIILNITDAWAASHERYGNIRNQLPGRLRGFLNRYIRDSFRGKGVVLMISVVVLSIVVAASEFLCSGQLYLASIIAGTSAGIFYSYKLELLLMFCVAFLVPSIVITVVVVKGRNMFSISQAILRHISLIKLITAVAMMLIIVAAWIVTR